MSRKSQTFEAVREVCGAETCAGASQARDILYGFMSHRETREVTDVLDRTSTVNHQLRHALVALLQIHLDDPKRCPNCSEHLPAHSYRCHVGRLLRDLRTQY